MEETVATRLKLFIDTSGLSTTQFADMCGIPRPSLSQLLTGRNKKVSDQLVRQIHTAFPDLSVVWLLFGEGPVKLSAGVGGGSTPVRGVSGGASMGSDAMSGVYSSKSDRDVSISSGNVSEGMEYSKENGLRMPGNDANISKNQSFETEMKIMDLQRQIENLRQNPRKVLQITIYYDDSTFETFIPKG